MERDEVWLQVTAAQGPAECGWAVLRVVEKIREESGAAGYEIAVLDWEPGLNTGTARSVLLALFGSDGLREFAGGWRGTVQWIARSPFRPEHKRKNWFVGVEVWQPAEESRFDTKELRFETMRASGPGGQHVNRVESAVRVTHVPSGVQACASEERSQHRNKKLALARLAEKLDAKQAREQANAKALRWQAHRSLERGNASRVYRGL